MDNKTVSRVSGKRTLLTRRLDLSCGLIKKENEHKNTVQVCIKNGVRPDWNEARAKPRRTSAPAELPPIKDALPKVKIKTRARALSLRGENNEMHINQWNTNKTQVYDSVLQERMSEIPSTAHGSVKAICIPVADSEQRPLWTKRDNCLETRCLGISDENSPLKHAGKDIGPKCLTQEALVCHELGFAEADEGSTSQKKGMIVRWLNSEVSNSSTRQGLEKSRAFP